MQSIVSARCAALCVALGIAISSCDGGGGGFSEIPLVTITSPASGALYSTGQTITFTATATDAEDGDLSAAIAWSSSLEGSLGTGASVSHALLIEGDHTITASVVDSDGASGATVLTITTVDGNPPPVAADDAVTTDEDTAVAVTLSATDPNADPITWHLDASPGHGSLTGTMPDVTYVPDADYNGSDSFTFHVNDGTTDSNVATVAVTITPVNDAPTATDDAVTVDEDVTTPITLIGGDVDGGSVSWHIWAQPAHGVLTGTAPDLTYTSASNYNGADLFTFYTSDGVLDSTLATVSITVAPVNDPPVANAQSVSTDEDVVLFFALTANDVEGDALTWVIDTQPANGQVLGTGPTVTFVPDADFNGSTSFTFHARDADDGPTATVSIVVNPVQDAPYADDQAVAVDEDGSVAITLTGGDVDGDAISFVVDTDPANGTLTGTAPNVTYAPEADWFGSDSFTFHTNDGTDDSATGTVSITVDPVNDPPVATDASAVVSESTPVTITLPATDIEPDTPEWFTSSPSNGSVVETATPGVWTYTPDPGFVGEETFTFWVNDGTDDSNVATVTVTVETPVHIELESGAAEVLETLEFKIKLDPAKMTTDQLEPWQMYNAYDTSTGWIRVCLVVSPTTLSTLEVQTLALNYETGATSAASAYAGGAFVVPAFYERSSSSDAFVEPAGGDWRWRARLSMHNEGTYHFYTCVGLQPEGAADPFAFPDDTLVLPDGAVWDYSSFTTAKYPHGASGLPIAAQAGSARGFVLPVASGDRLFRMATPAEPTAGEAFYGVGNCRCWNLKHTDIYAEGAARWDSAYVPFDAQMASLAAAGGNMFGWWLVSWDSAPVHGVDDPNNLRIYYEQWDDNGDGESDSGERQDITAAAGTGFEPYRYFDQGRCKKVDALLDAAEANNVVILMTLWPHADLRITGDGWDEWTTIARYGVSWDDRVGHWLDGEVTFLNHYSDPVTATSDGGFTGWATLSATPSDFVSGANWAGTPGFYQRNYIRYCVARWGCRRGLGLWEVASEILGTSISDPEEAAWRANVTTFIDAVSPYKQPVSSSAHSVTDLWANDITNADYVCTHGYCEVTDGTITTGMNDDNLESGGWVKDNDAYRASVLTQQNDYYHTDMGAQTKPVFSGEIGACQRRPGTNGSSGDARDVPIALTDTGGEAQESMGDGSVAWRYRKSVSTYHYAVWTSLLCKGAATPLAWTDGKEFGEMAARAGNTRFGAANYEIDYHAELAAVSNVVNALSLETLTESATVSTSGLVTSDGFHVFRLSDASGALLWVSRETHDAGDDDTQVFIDLSAFGVSSSWGTVEWYNPWTGAQHSTAASQDVTDLDTKLHLMTFTRACAGDGAGNGAHEQEDVLIWVTP